MLTLAISLFLAAGSPADLALPFLKAVKLSDPTIQALPRCGRRGMRGLVVSDDGTAIFGNDGNAVRMSSDTPSSSAMQIFVRNDPPGQAAMTSNQAGWLQSEG